MKLNHGLGWLKYEVIKCFIDSSTLQTKIQEHLRAFYHLHVSAVQLHFTYICDDMGNVRVQLQGVIRKEGAK